ncbi:hypothetical protein ACF0H5_002807 [Mactra antiquata]
MSLKSIDSDDLTAVSTISSPPSNNDFKTTVDGVSSVHKDDLCCKSQMSTLQGLSTSLHDSLFHMESLQDGNMKDKLKTETSQQLPWSDFLGPSSCSPGTSPPTTFKVPCLSLQDFNSSSNIMYWNSVGSNQNLSDVSNEDISSPSRQSSTMPGLPSPSRKQCSPSHSQESYNSPPISKSHGSLQAPVFNENPSCYAYLRGKLDPFSSISVDCFNAAVNEDAVPKIGKKSGGHNTKLKQTKFRTLSMAHFYDKDHKSSTVNLTHKAITCRVFTTVSSHAVNQENNDSSAITKTTFTTMTTPSLPKLGSPGSSGSPTCGSSGQQAGNPDLKRHRYNQTALALQQSGLMKTTIKTAELLRKSKILQQELVKLRKEASIFMHSVLNNPENKHLKDLYLPKKDPPQSDT